MSPKRKTATRKSHCLRAYPVILYVLLATLGGCAALMDAPEIDADGNITGGRPKLNSLLKMISKGRSELPADVSQNLSFVIHVYPITSYMVLLEGSFPKSDNIKASPYSMIACLDSAKSAELAVITLITTKPDGSTTQTTAPFLWENGQWVVDTFPGFQLKDGTLPQNDISKQPHPHMPDKEEEEEEEED